MKGYFTCGYNQLSAIRADGGKKGNFNLTGLQHGQQPPEAQDPIGEGDILILSGLGLSTHQTNHTKQVMSIHFVFKKESLAKQKNDSLQINLL